MGRGDAEALLTLMGLPIGLLGKALYEGSAMCKIGEDQSLAVLAPLGLPGVFEIRALGTGPRARDAAALGAWSLHY